MPEFIQVKVELHDEWEARSPRLKKALNAYEVRVQKGDQFTTQTKVKIGADNKAETEYISPSILLTISGVRLATEAEIIQTLNKFGITIIKITSKVSW